MERGDAWLLPAQLGSPALPKTFFSLIALLAQGNTTYVPPSCGWQRYSAFDQAFMTISLIAPLCWEQTVEEGLWAKIIISKAW